MKKCECGHAHCCHENVEKVRIETKNEFGHAYAFLRKKCSDCGAEIGDEVCCE